MARRWITHKFGGSSLADARAHSAVAEIILESAEHRRAVVVSAMRGVTDALIEMVSLAAGQDSSLQGRVSDLAHAEKALVTELLGASGEALIADIDRDLVDIEAVLRGTQVVGSASLSAIEVVSGFGEVWSARVLAAYLASKGAPSAWLDAREVLVVRQAETAPLVDWEASKANLEEWLRGSEADPVIITGYIASDQDGLPVTLGRNGSDYSASIFASLLDATEIVIWTDVDGVLSADPSLVPAAHLLEELSYDEAMELAYFGARVIHPATMTPAVNRGIPIVIRNTFNPSSPGTRIRATSDAGTPVKGFASVGDMALLNLEGTAMIGVPGISERLFGALRATGVSVVMISQGSSEHSICFAIPENQVDRAVRAIEGAFALERQYGQIQDLEVTPGCTILAAVGDSMSGTPGIAARLFSSLARVGVNVKAIAQGASERNVSIVIDSSDATRALRAAHSGFYLSDQTLSIGLIGAGHVGSALLDQMAQRLGWLRTEFGVDLRIRAIATTSGMLLDEDGVSLDSWRDRLRGSGGDLTATDLDVLGSHVKTESVPHAAIIDCSANEEIALRYGDWLGRGIHVITPNKKASSGSMEYYRTLQASRQAHYLYETTVGAALPIIQTLRDLVQTGDEIHRIEGIFSGTLSYLFNNLDGTVPFSKIVASAKEKGYTEPDPREDLSGTDVARKLVILAREMGLEVSLSDIPVESLVPDGLESGSVDDFLTNLGEFDSEMERLTADARARDEVLRFVGVIDPGKGCQVSLRSYKSQHPFARIQLTDNIVQFETARYHESPLVVQGPGAGPEITAGGVFADLLRLANYLGASL